MTTEKTTTENRNRRLWARGLGAFVLASTIALASGGVAAADECPIPANQFEPDPATTSVFLPKWCSWRTRGNNPFFKLRPGYRIVLESDEEKLVATVLDETKWVDGVRTRVLEEAHYEKDGDELILIERSLNYFARCSQTNSIFYFGEDVEFFDEDGNVIDSHGAWLAGRHGAKPGIVMPGTPLVGGKYYEELAPEDTALDKAEILSVEPSCRLGDLRFNRPCVAVEGSNDCDDDTDMKLYVAGIGVVADDDLELVEYGFVDEEDDDD